MVKTRTQIKLDAYTHVLDNVLELDPDHPVREWLDQNDYKDIVSLLNMNVANIAHTLYQPDGEKKPITLAPSHVGLLESLIFYKVYCSDEGARLKIEDWEQVTGEHFDTFRVSAHHDRYNHGRLANGIASGDQSGSKTNSPRAVDPLAEWCKGVKRDPSVFPTLKTQKQYHKWYQVVKTWAAAQRVDEVLDPDYVPSPADEPVFLEKQKYMYAVFTSILQTDQGKMIVREHQDYGDAQAVHRDFIAYATKSTQAKIDASSILSYLTTFKLGHQPWNGAYESFILHWLEQVCQYDEMKDPDSHLATEMKQQLLENAVEEVPDLRSVKWLSGSFISSY